MAGDPRFGAGDAPRATGDLREGDVRSPRVLGLADDAPPAARGGLDRARGEGPRGRRVGSQERSGGRATGDGGGGSIQVRERAPLDNGGGAEGDRAEVLRTPGPGAGPPGGGREARGGPGAPSQGDQVHGNGPRGREGPVRAGLRRADDETPDVRERSRREEQVIRDQGCRAGGPRSPDPGPGGSPPRPRGALGAGAVGTPG